MLLGKGGNAMEKNLELIKLNSNYSLKIVGEDNKIINLINLKIESKDIYDLLIKDSINEKHFKFNLSTKLDEKEDKRIFDQIKMLFSKIEESLNKLDEKSESAD